MTSIHITDCCLLQDQMFLSQPWKNGLENPSSWQVDQLSVEATVPPPWIGLDVSESELPSCQYLSKELMAANKRFLFLMGIRERTHCGLRSIRSERLQLHFWENKV